MATVGVRGHLGLCCGAWAVCIPTFDLPCSFVQRDALRNLRNAIRCGLPAGLQAPKKKRQPKQAAAADAGGSSSKQTVRIKVTAIGLIIGKGGATRSVVLRRARTAFPTALRKHCPKLSHAKGTPAMRIAAVNQLWLSFRLRV